MFLRNSLRLLFVVPILMFLLMSCSTKSSNEILLGSSLSSFNAKVSKQNYSSYDEHNNGEITPDKRKSKYFKGTGKFTGTIAKVDKAKTYSGDDGITLNLVNVPINQAAKVVLGDTLKINYTIDPRAKGQITLQTSNPISRQALLDSFETILLAQGIAIVEDQNHYKVLPASQVANQVRRIRNKFGSRKASVGQKTIIAPLQYVAADEMARVLKPLAPQNAILSVDKRRNLLILTGISSELNALLDSIAVFDVDQMKGMSFALIPITSANPDDIVQELDTIFSSDQVGIPKGLLRFIPNKRLNAVLIISPQPSYLNVADKWIKRLDKSGRKVTEQLYVYKIQNRPAAELTKILQQIFLGQSDTEDTASSSSLSSDTNTGTSSVAPGLTRSTISNDATRRPVNTLVPRRPSAISSSNSRKTVDSLRIVTDEANNSLLIMASPADYKRILSVLKRVDVIPNQVLIEATIAEVTLNDELKFGLKWFFQKGKSGFSLSDSATGSITSAFPGFSYFFSTPKVQVALDALASVTQVNIVSSPSIMVLDNKKAILQVGDQVPIATQSAVDVSDRTAPIVNSVSFKDTGVILSVRPRVNDNGRVLLEIEQEVSDVTQTTTSGIDSPTIQQRKIKTTVVVNDGSSLTLGGLIQNSNNKNSSQVPLLGDIPVVGNLFKQKSDTIKRTELLIIITPHVVRDNREAYQVTDEFRRKLNKSIQNGRPDAEQNFRRVFE